MDDRSPILEFANANPIPVYVAPVPVITSDIVVLMETGDVVTTEAGALFFTNVLSSDIAEQIPI